MMFSLLMYPESWSDSKHYMVDSILMILWIHVVNINLNYLNGLVMYRSNSMSRVNELELKMPLECTFGVDLEQFRQNGQEMQLLFEQGTVSDSLQFNFIHRRIY